MARLETGGAGNFSINCIKEGTIMDFQDLSQEKGKDVYWVIKLQTDDSQYEDRIIIAGDFKQGENPGTIAPNWLIARVNSFLNFFGYAGGFNIRGEFETPEGQVVVDIEREIIEALKNHSCECLCYVYKEWSKRDNKAYTKVDSKLFNRNEREEMEAYVANAISKGFIKVYTGDNPPQQQSQAPMQNRTPLRNGLTPKI
jgi:hypothetical protein